MIVIDNLRRPGVDSFSAALEKLPQTTRKVLCEIGSVRRFKNGEALLKSNVFAPHVFIILKGKVKIRGIVAKGDEILLRWLQPSEFVGLASFLGQIPLPVEAVACGSVEVVQIDTRALQRHLETDPLGSMAFGRMVGIFACELMQLFVSIAAKRLDQRILVVLRRLATHEPHTQKTGEVCLHISQQEIAQAVGASRQRVSIELQKLCESGSLRLGYKQVFLRLDKDHWAAGGS